MFGKSKTVFEKAKPNNLQARADNVFADNVYAM
jgi:hypothetical protein